MNANAITNETEVKVTKGINVTRALTRIKHLEELIDKLKSNSQFFSTDTLAKIEKNPLAVAEFKRKTKSNFDQYLALNNEYLALKRAIRQSNETTTIILSGKEVTVADAIVMKNRLSARKSFLKIVREQYANARTAVENAENRTDAEATALRERLTRDLSNSGVSKETITSMVEEQVKLLRHENYRQLVGLEEIINWIPEEEDRLVDIEEELDYLLSEANASTIINIQYS